MKSFPLVTLCSLIAMCSLLQSSSAQINPAEAPAPQESKNLKLPKQPPLVFRDISGVEHSLPCKPTSKSTVLVFINTQCPIANAYHPTLQKLKEGFASANFEWVMIHADPEVTIEAARKHQLEYNITWAIALDPGNNIARRVAAKVTPEAVIIDGHDRVIYRGRIDDLYQTYGRKRPAPTTADLHDALVSILNNQPIRRPETRAIGCIIRYAD